jgi:hypothetical protein
MTTVYFSFDITFSTTVCPYAFLNSYLHHLGLFEITNSLIYKNRLEFINIDDDLALIGGLNIKRLKYLEMSVLFDELNAKIMYPKIFQNISFLEITGSLYGIQSDLFNSYPRLEYLLFFLDSLRNFFHEGKGSIDWMSNLNRGLNVNLSNPLELKRNSNRVLIVRFSDILVNHLTTEYTYPDED